MLSVIATFVRHCGDLLDRRRIAKCCAFLLAFEIAAFLFFAAGTYGLIVPLKRPTSTDFVSFYAAGSLANAGTPELVYDRTAHYAAEQSATQPGIRYNYFYYPPVFVMLCAIIARLPYLPAFIAFEAAGFALYGLVMAKILGDWRWTTLLPVIAFPAVLWNIGVGQTAFLTASLFGAATLLVDRRPVIAGLLFGAVSYKPHFGLLIPVALAAGRHWRAFAAAALSAAGLALGSLLLFGPSTWAAFLSAVTAASPVYESGVKLAGYVTPFGALRMLGAPPAAAFVVQGLVSLAVIAGVAWVWARDLSLPVRAAALCAATVIATPIVMWYDLLLAAVAGAWLCAGAKISPSARAMLAALVIAIVYPAEFSQTYHIPIGPIAALAFVCLIARIAWHEAKADVPPAASRGDGFFPNGPGQSPLAAATGSAAIGTGATIGRSVAMRVEAPSLDLWRAT